MPCCGKPAGAWSRNAPPTACSRAPRFCCCVPSRRHCPGCACRCCAYGGWPIGLRVRWRNWRGPPPI
ncbi:diguanylate cyclase (GGDEF) domain protein, partial [Bordetella holmesii H620]